MVDEKRKAKKNILILEKNPELGCALSAAFRSSDYRVQLTDRTEDILETINIFLQYQCDIDILLLDISDEKHSTALTIIERSNLTIPVLAVSSTDDKALLIDVLNRKNTEFLERFMDLHRNIA